MAAASAPPLTQFVDSIGEIVEFCHADGTRERKRWPAPVTFVAMEHGREVWRFMAAARHRSHRVEGLAAMMVLHAFQKRFQEPQRAHREAYMKSGSAFIRLLRSHIIETDCSMYPETLHGTYSNDGWSSRGDLFAFYVRRSEAERAGLRPLPVAPQPPALDSTAFALLRTATDGPFELLPGRVRGWDAANYLFQLDGLRSIALGLRYSGSPVVDAEGRLLGLVTAGTDPGDDGHANGDHPTLFFGPAGAVREYLAVLGPPCPRYPEAHPSTVASNEPCSCRLRNARGGEDSAAGSRPVLCEACGEVLCPDCPLLP